MIEFCKVRNVKSPVRANDTDAGIDFYIPEWSEEFQKVLREKNKMTWVDKDGIILEAGRRVLIPSGLKVHFQDGYALIAFNKSGVATKTGAIVGACVVDSGYRNEVHLSLINTSEKNIFLEYGQKALQFILIPVSLEQTKEISPEEYDSLEKTSRGLGGFGSTGIK